MTINHPSLIKSAFYVSNWLMGSDYEELVPRTIAWLSHIPIITLALYARESEHLICAAPESKRSVRKEFSLVLLEELFQFVFFFNYYPKDEIVQIFRTVSNA